MFSLDRILPIGKSKRHTLSATILLLVISANLARLSSIRERRTHFQRDVCEQIPSRKQIQIEKHASIKYPVSELSILKLPEHPSSGPGRICQTASQKSARQDDLCTNLRAPESVKMRQAQPELKKVEILHAAQETLLRI